jgi:hypothetical protein
VNWFFQKILVPFVGIRGRNEFLNQEESPRQRATSRQKGVSIAKFQPLLCAF